MMKKSLLFLVLAFYSGVPVFSQERGEALERIFARLDQDGDGKILVKDLPPMLRQSLAKLDKDSDGQLDKDEMKKAPMGEILKDAGRSFEKLRQQFQDLDQDGDGKVALDQFPEDTRARLKRLDRNKDGSIDRKELQELRNMMLPGMMPPGVEGRKPAESDRPDAAAAMLERAQQLFKQYDQDGDGKIALSDLPDPIQQRMVDVDANQDGQLDKQELREFANRIRQRAEKSDKERKGDKDEKGDKKGRGDRGDDLSPQRPKRPPTQDDSSAGKGGVGNKGAGGNKGADDSKGGDGAGNGKAK